MTTILATPVYGEALTVAHVATGAAAPLAAEVARLQSAAGWTVTDGADDADTVVLWGLTAGAARDELAGRRPTVVVLDAADVRTVLTRPTAWARELRRSAATSLLLLPAELAERWTRWGPPVPLAHRPAGLPDEAAVTVLSAWVARAHAYGRRAG
ncbi:hypothetical protein [Modestobacter roseus]|uniref:hypothetical protein n=1 Tax=Modestobacter roseus TaxID=1181884 RepID=UPI0012960CA7|nr:hypothetical protein [Modestobacter roseus]MQA34000.1 hypothetical protein [Modestobacter roseus]